MKLLALALLAVVGVQAPDLSHGEAIYTDRCQSCHGSHGDGQAASLVGVVGRPAASLSGFVYSRALSASGVIWTPEALDLFLTSPTGMIPRTAMPVTLNDPNDRADVIAYLAARAR